MGDSVTGRHSRAGPAKRPSPEGGGGQHAVSAGSQTLAARPALPQADDITSKKDLLYRTRNSAQRYMAAWMEGCLGENGYMYMYG